MQQYDDNNIFAKILSGSIKTDKVFEDEFLIVIKDIHPVAPVHLLVIPKGKYKDYQDFLEYAPPTQVLHYFASIPKIAKTLGITGYRLITNKGLESGQTVFHFHTHIISGKKLNCF